MIPLLFHRCGARLCRTLEILDLLMHRLGAFNSEVLTIPSNDIFQSYGPPPVHPSQMASPPASHPHVRNPGHNWNPSSAMPSRSDAYTSSSHRMGQSMHPSAYQSPGHHPHQTLHSAHHPASVSPSTRHGSEYRPSTSGPVGMSAYPSASASYSRVAPPQVAPLQAGPSSSQYSRNVATAHAPTSSSEDLGTSNSKTKYECSYCGKGFLRPSALKVIGSESLIHTKLTTYAFLLPADPYHFTYRRQG